ncbi:unnamed protein product [Cylindrotheca closterium]|uniref:Uncharacterized protein n=1 Tax=Cylindrotheca closterium TaxID=2856 RepID=A0AAD2FPU9_9STRA|nr:unnamed protein product [Cylindrotheca closterium]
MCQRPVFPVASASSSLAKQLTTAVAPRTTELTSNNLIRTATNPDSAAGKRVRFEPPCTLNSFSEPTYSLCDEDKESMWWTREELTLLSPSPKSVVSDPSVPMCLILFMISNLSILSIAACVMALD